MSTQNITPEFASAYARAISRTTSVMADATNPFHKNVYATLEAHISATKTIFASEGLAIVQFPVSNEKSVGIETMVLHESGGFISRHVCIPVSDGIKGQDAGSLFSYLRRYAIASVANVATSDDDGEVDRVVRSVVTNSPQPVAKPVAKVSEAKAIEQAYKAKEYPTDSAGDDMKLILHFGKNKGKALYELPSNSLDWYIEKFEAKPYNGVVNPLDTKLREALDNIVASRKSKPSSDDVPF